MSRRPLRSEYMAAIECKDMKKKHIYESFSQFLLNFARVKAAMLQTDYQY